MMTCALKAQCRSRALCKDETPEAALARSPLTQAVAPRLLLWDTVGSGWDLSHCCQGLLCSQKQHCSQRPIIWPLSSWCCACFFQSILPSLELSKRTISPTSKEELPAQESLGASSSALCLSTASFSKGFPHLSQPLPCTGYFPYYRTEAGICTGPLQRQGSFTRIEGLETKEGEQSVWNLRSTCLMSWEERRVFVNVDVKEKILKPMTTWKSAWIWIK